MFRSIASIAVAGLLLVGCGSSISREAQEALGLEGAPEWVLNMGDGDYSAVGSAFIIDKNLGFAQREATDIARAEIASQIQTSVKKVMDKVTNTQDKSITSQTMERIKSVTSQIISGSKPSGMWVTKDAQQVFILVKLGIGNVNQIKKVLANEKIDYNAVEQQMKDDRKQAQQAQASEKAKPSSTEEEW